MFTPIPRLDAAALENRHARAWRATALLALAAVATSMALTGPLATPAQGANPVVCDAVDSQVSYANCLAALNAVVTPDPAYTITITGDFDIEPAPLEYTNSADLTITSDGTLRYFVSGWSGSLDDNRFLHMNTDADLTINGLIIIGFTSFAEGGAIRAHDGAVTVTGGTWLFANRSYTNGGAIYTDAGDITIEDGSEAEENVAHSNGGALFSQSGTVTVTDAGVVDNEASLSGGGIYTGSGNVLIDDSSEVDDNVGRFGGAIYSESGTVAIDGASTLHRNRAHQSGGAIAASSGPVTVSGDSAFAHNVAGLNGGAILVFDGAVTIEDSTLARNDSAVDGPGSGGAIYAVFGDVRVTSSTLHDNTTVDNGGAIYADGGTTTITTSTLHNNQAANGGAVAMGTGSTVVTASTLTGNSAGFGSTFYFDGIGSSLDLTTSVIDPGTSNNACAGPGYLPESASSGGYNWSVDPTCWFVGGAGDTPNGTDPGLGPLADNGGPTLTRLPLWNSPLVDQVPGPSALCDPTETGVDQRGEARNVNGSCDIGAVEFASAPDYDVTVVASPTTIDAAGEVIDFAITVTNTGNVPLTDLEASATLLSALDCDAVATLAIGDDVTLTCTGASHAATQLEVDYADISNTTTVTANAFATGPLSRDTITAVSVDYAPDIHLAPTVDGLLIAGTILTYNVQVDNTGNVTLDVELLVNDAAVTIAAPCDTPFEAAPGTSVNCTATYTVTPGDVAAQSVTHHFDALGRNPLSGVNATGASITTSLAAFSVGVGSVQTVNAVVYGATDAHTVNWTEASAASTPPPAGLAMPFGLIGFTADVASAGDSVTVVLEIPSPVTQLWKLQGGSWFEVDGAVFAGTTVTYTLTDGGFGDSDGVANGEIVDPIALVLSAHFTG